MLSPAAAKTINQTMRMIGMEFFSSMSPLYPQQFGNVAAGMGYFNKYIKHHGGQGVKWSLESGTVYQTQIEDLPLKCGILGETTKPRLPEGVNT
jgi:hypothetical protein